jgi:hypothetical protein
MPACAIATKALTEVKVLTAATTLAALNHFVHLVACHVLSMPDA